ncbi:hypothetical protein [Bordetella genomosp. 4]|nr:hypothetical protein [Bordetella genomosp. 4]
MKLSMFALPIIAAGLVLGGCSHRDHDGSSTYDRPGYQNSAPPPPPGSVPDNNSNTPSPGYPATGGSK